MKLLTRAFYNKSAEIVAKQLLGQYLVREGKKYKITETEAYLGPHDLAAHSRFGKTKRTEIMFGPAGFAYIYLVYGMYHCLNVVAGPEGAAVLVRSVEGINGPGRVCRELGITRELNGIDVTTPGPLFIAQGKKISPEKVIVGPRVGVDYAKEWKDLPLRFVLRLKNEKTHRKRN
jgi:DNA-3-methyladenine glycosylase